VPGGCQSGIGCIEIGTGPLRPERTSMVEWATVANLATAGGTALLAVATFSATRSANAAARSAERGLIEGLRPILVPSRWEDPIQKVQFVDGRWFAVRGGRAVLETTDEAVYLVMSLRNVGRGTAVLHGWDLTADVSAPHREPADFHRLTRDIYLAPGDAGFCQAALREPGTEEFRDLTARGEDDQPFRVDVLYSDVEGGQRVITRMGLSPSPVHDGEKPERKEWAVSASRHWHLDRPDPR
jgi:hypothetical protein